MGLGRFCNATERFAEAKIFLRRALAIYIKRIRADHTRLAHCPRELARALVKQNKFADALPIAMAAHEVFRDKYGDENRFTPRTAELAEIASNQSASKKAASKKRGK